MCYYFLSTGLGIQPSPYNIETPYNKYSVFAHNGPPPAPGGSCRSGGTGGFNGPKRDIYRKRISMNVR